MKKLEAAAITILLVFFAVICFKSQKWASVTVDEFAHLPAGYYYWLTGDYRLYGKNPPLIKMVASLPLLWMKAKAEVNLSVLPRSGWLPWLYGTDFMIKNQAEYLGIFSAGRMMIILLGLGLGLMLYFYSRSLYGRAGAILSLAVFALCPNMLAHSQLATVDIGASLFIFLALLSLIGYLKKPGWARAGLAGLALGLAQLSKFSSLSLLLFYAAAPVLPVWPFRSDKLGLRRLWLRGLQVGAMILIWLFLVAACYRFGGLFKTVGNLDLRSSQMKRVQKYTSALPAPFPEIYLLGLDRQLEDMEQGEFANYFMGKWYNGADRRYFLVALLVKTPIPILVLFLWAILLGRSARPASRKFEPEEILILLVMAWIFFLFDFRNSLQIGVRYLLPLFPLAYLLLGRIGKALSGSSIPKKIIPAGLMIWLFAECLSSYPNYLSYFNEFAGGPKNGHNVLLDSNLDWGQDLPALAEFMKKNRIEKIELFYFGQPFPELYGINYQLLGREPRLKYAAISAQYYYSKGIFYYPLLYYQPLDTLLEHKQPVVLSKSVLTPYLGKEPVARCGNSILVFKND